MTCISRSGVITNPVRPTAKHTAIVIRPTMKAENPARKQNCAWYM